MVRRQDLYFLYISIENAAWLMACHGHWFSLYCSVFWTPANNHSFRGGGMAKIWAISFIWGSMYVTKCLIVFLCSWFQHIWSGSWLNLRFPAAFMHGRSIALILRAKTYGYVLRSASSRHLGFFVEASGPLRGISASWIGHGAIVQETWQWRERLSVHGRNYMFGTRGPAKSNARMCVAISRSTRAVSGALSYF